MPNSTGTTSRIPERPATQGEHFWFAREHKSIIFLIITLAMVGAYLAFSIPIAVFPTTDFPRVIVGVDNGVMPIDQMLVTITRPIEEAVSGVQGIQDVRSITSRGSAEVDLFFRLASGHVSSPSARQRSPRSSRGHAATDGQSLERAAGILQLSDPGLWLTSDALSQQQLWESATYDIKPRLASLPGVSTILVQGGQVPEFHIVPQPAKLRATVVSISQLVSAVDRSNIIQSPGLFPQNHQLYLGLITGQAHDEQELGRIFVKNSASGSPIYVGDVANVVSSFEPHFTIVTANGRPAVLININRQPGSNTMQVATEVKGEMARIRKEPAPERACEHVL